MKPRLLAVLLPLVLLLAPAFAHQQQEAVTRVLFNPRSGNIEVMHRFLLHDVEHAVKRLRKAEADILGSREERQFFADYVNRGFAMADQDGRTLPLNPVGHEIEGRFLWVYAETAIPAGIVSLSIRHEALLDVWPKQVNLLNIERDGEVRSATFTGGATTAVIDLRGR